MPSINQFTTLRLRLPGADLPKIDELRASPFFSHIQEKTLKRILEKVSTKTYGRGQLIFQRGDAASAFFVVLSGKVKVRVISESGKEQVLHFYEAGSSFGEAAVLGQGNFPADAHVMEETRVARVPAEPFLAEIRQDPDFALQVMRSMSLRLVEFAQIIESLSIHEVKGRLANYLHQAQVAGGNGETFELPVSKGELSRLLGTTAESLSRTLRKLSEEGVISVKGRRITILLADQLQQLSEL